MKRILTSAVALAAATTGAHAGGVERATQSVAILFEKGSYAELSFGRVDPDVSGVAFGERSGDITPSYNIWSLGYKADIGDRMALAVIIEEPIGVSSDFPDGQYVTAGTTTDLSSAAITALLMYRLENNLSVYGGLRLQSSEFTSNIIAPAIGVNNYLVQTSQETDLGYVVGIAWERPEIAARVALTYNSAITHDFESSETGLAPVTLKETFETEVPQSVNLEFQTGISKDTIIFGSVRWVEWSAFEIAPFYFPRTLLEYAKDRVTYNLGVGRRFNEQWSGAVTFGYEPSDGELTSNIGPMDGMSSIGLGATYTMDKVKITAGVRYVDLGDATTVAPVSARFADNYGVGFAIRVGYTF
jgi:long-chain fatty acid transport protein